MTHRDTIADLLAMPASAISDDHDKDINTMAERFTIYAGEPVAAILAGFEDNRSGRINQVADSYRMLIEEAVPVLTEAEWSATLDALNGSWLQDETHLRLMWASIADSAPDGLADKWGVDLDALAGKVRGMSIAQLLALREIVWRFWNSVDGSDKPVGDLLRDCGAKFAD